MLGIASPAVSPDGRWVAFRALNALWLAATSGRGQPRKLVADGYFNSDPDFSPDGTKLLYASDRDGTADLWLYDLQTGADSKLSSLPGAQTAPRFSPDGKQVAYQDQDGIAWVLDLASGQVRQLTPTLFQPGRVSWSRDGKTLVLAAVKPFSKRFREGTSQLLYVDVATAALEYVEPMPFRSLTTRGDDGPVFSPDGKWLAFVVESLLYVAPVDQRGRFTSEPRAVTSEVTDSPVWQDNTTLLYLNNGRLRRTTVSGSRPQTIKLDLHWRRATVNQHVTIHAGALWDGRATTLRRDVDVVLDGSRIAAVRPHQGQADVDASELTVMPGLIDAHNHWHLRGRAWGARQGNLWLSYGITTTRSPGDPVYQMQETREALAHGSLLGPRYFATGEAIDGSRVYYNFMRPTLSLRQLGLELDRVEGLAYDLVKTYVRLPIEYQRRAIAAVHRLGLQLSSHYLYPAEHLGMDGMEHTGATNRLGYSHTVSRLGRAYADVVTLFTKAGLSVTPTLFNSTMAACRRSVAADRPAYDGALPLLGVRRLADRGEHGIGTGGRDDAGVAPRQRRHGAANPSRWRLRHLRHRLALGQHRDLPARQSAIDGRRRLHAVRGPHDSNPESSEVAQPRGQARRHQTRRPGRPVLRHRRPTRRHPSSRRSRPRDARRQAAHDQRLARPVRRRHPSRTCSPHHQRPAATNPRTSPRPRRQVLVARTRVAPQSLLRGLTRGRVVGADPRGATRTRSVGFEEAEPDLADGRVGGDGVPEAVQRDLAGDGDRGRVEQFGDIGPDRGEADQDVAVLVDDHPGLAAVVVGVQCGAGDRPEVVVDDPDLVAGRRCGFGGQADGGDFGIGEDHLGDGAFVGGDRMASPRTQVELLAVGSCGDRVSQSASLVLAVMGQQARLFTSPAAYSQPSSTGLPVIVDTRACRRRAASLRG